MYHLYAKYIHWNKCPEKYDKKKNLNYIKSLFGKMFQYFHNVYIKSITQ